MLVKRFVFTVIKWIGGAILVIAAFTFIGIVGHSDLEGLDPTVEMWSFITYIKFLLGALLSGFVGAFILAFGDYYKGYAEEDIESFEEYWS
jgi:hypothetical protein